MPPRKPIRSPPQPETPCAEALRSWLAEHTLSEVAEGAQVDRDQLRRWTEGRVVPRADELARVAEYVGAQGWRLTALMEELGRAS